MRRCSASAHRALCASSLLFGSAAVALALVLAPVAENFDAIRRCACRGDGLDLTSTGSIGKRSGYTIRRSVLQAPGEVCIIRDNGLRSGDC